MSVVTNGTNSKGSWEISGTSATLKSNEEGKNYFVISGISTGSGSLFLDANSTVNVSDGFVSLNNNLLNNSNVTISNFDTDTTFKLALATTGNDSVNTLGGVLDNGSLSVSVDNGTASILGTNQVYYRVTGNSRNAITYYAASTPGALATFSGLSAGSTSTGISINAENYAITLADSVLGQSAISLVKSGTAVNGVAPENINFHFLLGGDSGAGSDGTEANDGKVGFLQDDNNNYWSLTGSGSLKTITYNHNVGQGWSLTQDSLGVEYSASTTSALMTLTNLSSAVDTQGGTSALNFITLEGAGGSAGSAGTIIMLGTSALSRDSVNPVTFVDNDPSDNYNFSLSLADNDANHGDNIAGNGIIGFEKQATVWSSLTNGEANYSYNTNEGWKLNGNQIAYTPLKNTQLAKISGISTTYSGSVAFDSTNTDVLYLTKEMIGTKDESVITLANLNGGRYKLAISSESTASIASTAIANYSSSRLLGNQR